MGLAHRHRPIPWRRREQQVGGPVHYRDHRRWDDPTTVDSTGRFTRDTQAVDQALLRPRSLSHPRSDHILYGHVPDPFLGLGEFW